MAKRTDEPSERPTLNVLPETWRVVHGLSERFELDKKLIAKRVFEFVEAHPDLLEVVLRSFEASKQPEFARLALERLAGVEVDNDGLDEVVHQNDPRQVALDKATKPSSRSKEGGSRKGRGATTR